MEIHYSSFGRVGFAPRVDQTRRLVGRPTGRYVVYVDESGDHGLEKVDEKYPVFTLALCVFEKSHYVDGVVSAIESFKFKHFGHDLVILHETDIHKERGCFRFRSRAHKDAFIEELTGIIKASEFVVVSCVIDKVRLRVRDQNPYHLALGFCVETLYELLQEKRQDEVTTYVVVECRGKKEDRQLEREFTRICTGANKFGKHLPLEMVFADKKANSSGLQLADLIARPIGLSVVRPTQTNRAFEIVKRKFFCGGGRSNAGKGYGGSSLKVHPPLVSERPR